MNRKRTDSINNMYRKIWGFAEVLVLTLVYYFVWFRLYRPAINSGLFLFRGRYVIMGVYFLLLYIVFRMCDSLNFGNLKLIDITVSQWISVILTNVITYFQLCLIANGMLRLEPIVLLTLIGFAFTFGCCWLFTALYYRFYSKKKMLLIYGSDHAMAIRDKFEKREKQFSISETISSDEELDAICKAVEQYDAVVINDIPAQKRNDILKYCYSAEIPVYMAPKVSDVIIRGSEALSLFDTPLLLVRPDGPSPIEDTIKRVMDILLSLIALIPAGIVMAAIAIAIKVEDHGPVFYRQNRVTKDDKEFAMFKFRSMIPDAEKKTGVVLAAEDDPRITKVGAFLRSHRLDELPQLFNILKGDMSFVGPRPERRELINEFTVEMPEFAFRTRVKGGLTGYAQVYGKYNTTAYDKLKLDLMYIENYSLLLDLKLLLMTPQILFRKESTEGIENDIDSNSVL